MAGGTDEASLTSQIDKKLQGDVSAEWLRCSIFKVPNHLRRISEQAYEPQVISIGPYHRGKDQLKKMEGYKMFYLKKLLERRPEIRLEEYVTFLKTREKKARKFYSEPLDHISGEEFVEMMLLDGCFIIELIRRSAMGKLRDETDNLLTHFILERAMLDLFLVENQLPFFILSELFKMTLMPNDEAKDFVDMAIKIFSEVVMPNCQIGRPQNQRIKHLLDLLYESCQAPSSHDCQEVRISCSILEKVRSVCPKAKLNCCSLEAVRSSPPEPLEEVRSAEEDQETEIVPAVPMSLPVRSRRSVCFWPFKTLRLPLLAKSGRQSASDHNRSEWQFIRSATELSEAGINFKKIEGRLFDIEFEKEVMSIPTLRIGDPTESILRNLVAYEQCFKGASSKCFTDYILFMDCLINTRRDVELLRHCGVIDNWLGNDEVVATIFNKLCDSVLISKKHFSYAKTFNKVNEHCERKCNRWKAYLWHNYVNTPWAVISVVAAVILLLLTVLQSVYSVLSFHIK